MKIFIKILCVISSSAFIFSAQAQYKIEVLDSSSFQLSEGVVLSKTSFRGLSVVDDFTIWVSGSRGTMARSIDGGKTFVFKQLKGYEKSDFRDIEAFDDKRAIIMSSGTPAYVLKTIDGGETWKEVYKNQDTAYFLDAMDFWDEARGVIVGDPIHQHFVILKTTNGGETWSELDTSITPWAFEGEAVFAASGTSLRCVGEYGRLCFVTGGKLSRVVGVDVKRKYTHSESEILSITQGKQSQGAFSFAFNDSASIVVGGDYLRDALVERNSCIQYLPASKKDKLSYNSNNDVNGYRSCITPINHESFVAVGTSGVDVYKNRKWKNIASESFNVVGKAKKGKAVFVAGAKGRIGRLLY